MQKLVRYIAARYYKPLVERWLSVERKYVYRGIRLLVHPDVFHPGFFFSTKLLLKQLRSLPLKGKTLLELGTGSGLIALYAAKKGADVTATDINRTAISYLHRNAEQNHLKMRVMESDLFDQIPKESFDYIVINPPYYFRQPLVPRDHAWYCGDNGEYFQRLFSGLGNYRHKNTVILMVLCAGGHRKRIEMIAGNSGILLNNVRIYRNLIEKNYIYHLSPATAQ